MMEDMERLNVAIVGGGPGCKAIMDMILAEKLSQLRMKLIGVVSTNPEAPGYLYAQEKEIYTTKDYHDLYEIKDLNIIIELTGRDEVASEIFKTKPPHVRLIDHVTARLFWDIFQIEEEWIEERREAEEALRKSEEEYRRLVDTSLTGIFIHQDHKYVFVNNRFAEIHGYKPEELLGKDPLTLIHPDQRESLREIASRRLKGEPAPERYQVRRLRKDGKTIWCEMMATAIEYEGRLAIAGNMIDITEAKLAEEALRKSEEKYSTLVESSLTGIYIDQGGKVVFANNKFAEIYGYSKDEIIGMDSRDVVHPEDRAFTNNIRTKRLKGEHAPSEYEARGLTKSGETIWIARRNTAIRYNGKSAVLGNIVDITERKDAEEKIRDSEERYRTVLEGSPDPVVVYDMEGKCIYVNPAFTTVFGWIPEELLGKKLDYVPDENWPETQMMIDKGLAGESFSGVESRRYTKDGKTLDVSISAAIHLNRDGTPVGSVHTLRDITERKRVEEALQRAHHELEDRVEERTAELAMATEQLKLELRERRRAQGALRTAHAELEKKAGDLLAANEELSQYAYVVSHDLKAPLRAIRNYADFLGEDLEEALDGDQRTYLDGLNHAVRQGEELVEDLLEFSRVGAISNPIETIQTGTFIKDLVESLNLTENIEVVVGNDNWPSIDAEPTLLRQILLNLISNAIKFNDSTHKRVEIGWLPVGEDRYEVFVRDNGIGIEDRHHEQIFRVFQRLHTSKEYEGTGLGLAIVKKAASKLHGSVRIESKAGGGSTFFVALPKTRKEG
jgi:PAS domain S-box-containing protein